MSEARAIRGSATTLLPVVPLADLCLFPEASLVLAAPLPPAARAIAIARRSERRVFALAERELRDQPLGHFHETGTIAHLSYVEASEDTAAKIEIDGLQRARVVTLLDGDTVVAEVERLAEGDPGDEWGAAVEALARYLHGHSRLRAFLEAQRRSSEPMAWVNLACQHLPITLKARQKLLDSDAASRCLRISRGLDALLRKERSGPVPRVQ
jgi:ATP-dependent Lon protease